MSRFKWMRGPRRHSWTVGFADNQAGATAIEYALIAAFISVSIAVVVPALGVNLSGLYDLIAGAF